MTGGTNAGEGDGGALFEEAVRHHRAGGLDEAAALYDKLLARQPDHADALHLRGLVAHQQGDHARAVGLIGRAIGLDGGRPSFHNNFGVAASALGRHEDAVPAFRRALAATPDDADLHRNLGIALQKLRRFDEALASFRAALALAPDSAVAHFNTANALQGLNRHAEAVAGFERALALEPDDPGTHNNLGMSLVALNRTERAVEHYRRALALAPDNAEFHNNLGNALDRLGRPAEAARCYRETLDRDPLHANALSQSALIARKICHWDGLAETEAAIVDHVRSGRIAVTPFSFLAITDDPALQSLCAAQYRKARTAAAVPPPGRSARPAGSRIRVGYFSEMFREHPLSYLIGELLELHDRSRFEICGFSYGADDGSPVRRRVEAAFDEFHDLQAAGEKETAERIAAAGIDILVDLNGLTERNRLAVLAHRPAPVQAHFLGYPGTLGTDFVDYLLVDDFVVPPDRAVDYAENLVRLPDCYQVNDRQRPIAPETPARAACGLPANGFVFCCFNQGYKITPALFDIWMGLLCDVPGSVLWLLQGTGPMERNLRGEAGRRGVDPGRLVFAPHAGLPAHLARIGLADLFLDTLPVNAHTTASDALWAGLPVLTCAGRAMAARVAGSLLHAVGLPELVTETLDEYAALARRLATEPDKLRGLRERLAANRETAPLFDTDRFRRHIERAYAEMWEISRAGAPPRPFRVPPAAG